MRARELLSSPGLMHFRVPSPHLEAESEGRVKRMHKSASLNRFNILFIVWGLWVNVLG
jgi:hypothetical protein